MFYFKNISSCPDDGLSDILKRVRTHPPKTRTFKPLCALSAPAMCRQKDTYIKPCYSYSQKVFLLTFANFFSGILRGWRAKLWCTSKGPVQRASSLEQNLLCQSQARLAAALLPIKCHAIPLTGPNCCRQGDRRTECPAARREFTSAVTSSCLPKNGDIHYFLN